MTKREAQDYARLVERFCKLGFTHDEVDQLLRIERTLRNWFTAECNGEIERDEDTDKPFAVSRAWINGLARERTTWPIADREAGARRRLDKIMQPRKRRFIAYIQSDPRGCALYIVPRKSIPKDSHIASCYTNGFAVCY